MAEIHNISDLKIISLLENELSAIRELAKEYPDYYDPTEPLSEVVKTILNEAKTMAFESLEGIFTESRLRREVSYLKSQIQALELEKQSEKDIARGYPVTSGGLCGAD